MVFASAPLLVVALAFIGAAIAVWFAGVRLSVTTERLDDRFHFGQAVGGLIVLAIATNLPEIAISISAARSGNVEVAVGNILGGIALQTVVLVLIDAVVRRGTGPLTYRVSSLVIAIEGLIVVVMLAVVLMATQLPGSATVGRIELSSIIIVLLWPGSLVLVQKARTGIPWRVVDGEKKEGKGASGADDGTKASRTAVTISVFVLAAVVTLIGGVVLERSGEVLAQSLGVSGIVFGATFLALATSLPEISTGIASARTGQDDLAISDIFGGNAFLPTLFLLISAVAGRAVLTEAQPVDLYLTALGIVLTAIYVGGLIFRSRRTTFGIGRDSLAVLIVYLVGLAGLVLMTIAS
jgi:cation:H+ antiporter